MCYRLAVLVVLERGGRGVERRRLRCWGGEEVEVLRSVTQERLIGRVEIVSIIEHVTSRGHEEPHPDGPHAP